KSAALLLVGRSTVRSRGYATHGRDARATTKAISGRAQKGMRLSGNWNGIFRRLDEKIAALLLVGRSTVRSRGYATHGQVARATMRAISGGAQRSTVVHATQFSASFAH